MNLAQFIAQAREDRGLTLRQLETAADDLNHAYIWRLEKGDKASPSKDAIERLSKALRLSERKRQILLLLAEIEIEDSLYKIMCERTDIDWACLESAATMSFRGERPKTKDDWMRVIDFINSL